MARAVFPDVAKQRQKQRRSRKEERKQEYKDILTREDLWLLIRICYKAHWGAVANGFVAGNHQQNEAKGTEAVERQSNLYNLKTTILHLSLK